MGLPNIEVADASGTLILLVEDNAINRRMIERQINHHGYATISVADAEQALELLRRRRFGLVITDFQMPLMDGCEFVKAFRNSSYDGCEDTPIVGMTADAIGMNTKQWLAAGVNEIVNKPLKLDALGETLRKWVSGKDDGR